MAMSDAISGSGLLDKRIPLNTSYSAADVGQGRPATKGAPKSEGAEADIDSDGYAEMRTEETTEEITVS